MKNGRPNRKVIRKRPSGRNSIIDADGHVRETDEQIMEYMSAGYRSRREAMLYFPLVPHHGWHRSIPANDFRYQDFRVPDWREWAGKLDEGNIELTVLYPTRFMHIGQIGNPRYAVELCRAYNDFLHEQFLNPRSPLPRHGAAAAPGCPGSCQRTAPRGKDPWHGRRYLAGGRATPSPRSRGVPSDFR